MRYDRAERTGQAALVAIALVVALGIGAVVLRGGADAPRPIGGVASPTATASPTPSARPPEVTFTQATCCTQTARGLRLLWTSSVPVTTAALALTPDPGFACATTVESPPVRGVGGCAGLLRGETDYVATLTLTTAGGAFPFEHRFRTMGNTLTGVRWFTEFEDPAADPLACAAASCRIIQNYTTGKDPLTAQGILELGRQFNRSRDPGLDPVAIATVLQRLEAANHYHYYRFDTREEATLAAIYWLVRSGKPVMAISLAGQHGPLVIGFQGTYGTYYGDATNRVSALVVQDPQRGDMDPRTQNRRPDKYRTPGFQTGQPISLDEWYSDEWWFRFPYQGVIRMPDGSLLNVERNDGAYPVPHWDRTFVILVDDGDAEHPPDREGRVKFR